ncbi:MAG: hypothetical protein ABI789_02825 [Usitatibacter sp.]
MKGPTRVRGDAAREAVMGSISGGDGVKIIAGPNDGCKILTG